jgi:hypothetical protein
MFYYDGDCAQISSQHFMLLKRPLVWRRLKESVYPSGF